MEVTLWETCMSAQTRPFISTIPFFFLSTFFCCIGGRITTSIFVRCNAYIVIELDWKRILEQLLICTLSEPTVKVIFWERVRSSTWVNHPTYTNICEI